MWFVTLIKLFSKFLETEVFGVCDGSLGDKCRKRAICESNPNANWFNNNITVYFIITYEVAILPEVLLKILRFIC